MIVVIGAGPAGLAAAREIAQAGESLIIIDSQPRIGGQYWRHRGEVSGYKSSRSQNYFDEIFTNPLITLITGAYIWSAEKTDTGFILNYLRGGSEHQIFATRIILATGAYDRSLPFPGWSVPGVMTPGAAQALLKGNGVVAGDEVIISGTGPFLLPVATALAEAGAKVSVFEAQSPFRWLKSFPALLLNPGKFIELLYYLRKFFVYRIPLKFGYAVTRYENGSATVSSVSHNLNKSGTHWEVKADVVAVGWGFQPDVTLGGILGCQEKLDRDGTVIFKVDAHQQSSIPHIWIAGEATGIGGADLALIEGEIAGRAAIRKRIGLLRRFTRFRKRLFAKALQRSYPVSDGWQSWLEDETLICRCEEVTQSQICHSVVQLGADSARTSKLFTRAGMGLCQGRICARNVNDLVSTQLGIVVSDDERIAAHNRPIAAPLSLGLLGGLQGDGKKG